MRPTDVIGRFAELLKAGDARQALALYEPGAAFVVEPRKVVTGHEAIGPALKGFAALRPVIRGDIEQIVYAGDLALVTNRWTLDGMAANGEQIHLSGRSADVLRRTSEGAWRIAIDDPWGGAQ
jgi:ketosteroid isomerase-like protein